MARDLVMLDGIANDLFRNPITVDIGRVPLCPSQRQLSRRKNGFNKSISNVQCSDLCRRQLSAVGMPEKKRQGTLVGRMMRATFSSSSTHACHCPEPIDMVPKIGTDTRKPLLPSCLYSALGVFEVALSTAIVDM